MNVKNEGEIAVREWPEPTIEPIGFFEAFNGSFITWIYWTVLLAWLVREVMRTRSGPAVSLRKVPMDAMILAPSFAVLEFAFQISRFVRGFTVEIRVYSPSAVLLDVWYAAYTAVWIILLAFGLTVLVAVHRWHHRKGVTKANQIQ